MSASITISRARFTEMERQLADVPAQRDELLEALSDAPVLNMLTDVPRFRQRHGDWVERARASIAKVQST